MKIGQIEKGRFKFIATQDAYRLAKFGKIYESDENGNIELEEGGMFCTYGDISKFHEQADLFIGVNKYIEIKEPSDTEKIYHLVNTLKYGDYVEWGDAHKQVMKFLGFCRNEAILQNIMYDDLVMTVPVQWLRKVGESSGKTTEEC